MTTTINASTVSGLVNTADTSGILQLQTASTAAVTIDTSQNVGVGVTPSAWRTAYGTKVIQFGPVSHVAGLSASSNNNRTSVGCNFYINSSGNQIYMNSDYTTEYQQTNGYHSFLTAPSGTAGGTASPVETMRISPTGAVILQGGSTSATGTGIAFPATQSASSDANTLDDYEEGTWTPTYYGSTIAGTTTYTGQKGLYVKIGKTVYIECDLAWSAKTGTGDGYIGGLPFNPNNYSTTDARALFYIGAYGGYSITGTLSGIVQNGSTYVILYVNNNATLTGSAIQNSGEVRFQFYYTTST